MSSFLDDLIKSRNVEAIGPMTWNPLTHTWQLPYRVKTPIGGIDSVEFIDARDLIFEELLMWPVTFIWSKYCQPCGPLQIRKL